MTQVFINGKEIDLIDVTSVYPTYQQNDIGEIASRQATYTNKFKAKFTPINIQILGGFGLVGSVSEIPYRLHTAKILEDGIEILSNGVAEISEFDSEYFYIQVRGSEKNFFSLLNTLSLQDIFPSMKINMDWQTIDAALLNDHIYTFGLTRSGYILKQENLKNSFDNFGFIEPNRTSPLYFARSIFQYIFDFMGYEVIHDLDQFETFKNLLLPSSKSVTSFSFGYGFEIDLKDFAPDIQTDDFLKEVMNRYGLMISVNENTKTVNFVRIEKIISDSETVDWSDKFHSIETAVQKVNNYAQKNVFKFTEDKERVKIWNIDTLEGVADELNGFIKLDNTTLGAEKTVMTSLFKKPSYAPLEYGPNFTTLYDVKTNSSVYRLIDLLEYTSKEARPEDFHPDIESQYSFMLDKFEEFKNQFPELIFAGGQYDRLKNSFNSFKVYFDFIYQDWEIINIENLFTAVQIFEDKINESPLQYEETLAAMDSIILSWESGIVAIDTPTDKFDSMLFYRTRINQAFTYRLKTPDGTIDRVKEYGYIPTYLETNFQIFIDLHYKNYTNLLSRYEILTCKINLNILDINKLDLFKRVYIKHLGGYFYINKVKNFQSNKLTSVELVKILNNTSTEESPGPTPSAPGLSGSIKNTYSGYESTGAVFEVYTFSANKTYIDFTITNEAGQTYFERQAVPTINERTNTWVISWNGDFDATSGGSGIANLILTNGEGEEFTIDSATFLIQDLGNPPTPTPPSPPTPSPTAPSPTAPSPTAPTPTVPSPTAPSPTAPTAPSPTAPTAPSPTAPTAPSPTAPTAPTAPTPTGNISCSENSISVESISNFNSVRFNICTINAVKTFVMVQINIFGIDEIYIKELEFANSNGVQVIRDFSYSENSFNSCYKGNIQGTAFLKIQNSAGDMITVASTPFEYDDGIDYVVNPGLQTSMTRECRSGEIKENGFKFYYFGSLNGNPGGAPFNLDSNFTITRLYSYIRYFGCGDKGSIFLEIQGSGPAPVISELEFYKRNGFLFGSPSSIIAGSSSGVWIYEWNNLPIFRDKYITPFDGGCVVYIKIRGNSPTAPTPTAPSPSPSAPSPTAPSPTAPSPSARSSFPSSTTRNFNSVCDGSMTETYWFNGQNFLPVNGDTCWTTNTGSTFLVAGYYRMTTDFYIQIGSNGLVISQNTCGGGF
jgi:hypothetical protein